jgi:ABC-type phosphate transport system permease subunit
MAYIQSPSGRRFLESAPIALDNAPRAVSAPVTRILLSLQAGVVLAAGGVGFIYASGRVIEEVAPALFTIGVLSIAFGAGFFASAILAYGLSERLGLLTPPSSRPSSE